MLLIAAFPRASGAAWVVVALSIPRMRAASRRSSPLWTPHARATSEIAASSPSRATMLMSRQRARRRSSGSVMLLPQSRTQSVREPASQRKFPGCGSTWAMCEALLHSSSQPMKGTANPTSTAAASCRSASPRAPARSWCIEQPPARDMAIAAPVQCPGSGRGTRTCHPDDCSRATVVPASRLSGAGTWARAPSASVSHTA
mmetsp:Transcript_17977/g.50951  ORF Transcript_17977/g.50951 Transcript_17977/m.50951 type:complete len:201 (+) Transcript_17977:125-727(+)